MSQNKSNVKHWIMFIAGFIIGLMMGMAIIISAEINKEEPKQVCPSCPDCRHPQIIVVNESQITESGGYLYYAIE